MKRYLLFSGDECYPMGGMNDFKGSFDSIEKFEYYLIQLDYKPDWYHLFDIVTESIVRQN